MRLLPPLLLTFTVLSMAACGAASAATAPSKVTVYRCTGQAGRLTLRDSPCIAGEHQVARDMLRPTDPPRRAVAASTKIVRGVERLPRDRVVYVTPPRTSYDCATPDGEHYTSDSPEGNPRWVPLWTLGYPATGYPLMPGPGIQEGGYGGRVDYRSGNSRVTLDAGRRYVSPGGGYGGYGGAPVVYAPAGSWIRDRCNPIPAAEACDQLRDRRDALDARYTSALQSEREAIVREERGIDARLGGECQ